MPYSGGWGVCLPFVSNISSFLYIPACVSVMGSGTSHGDVYVLQRRVPWRDPTAGLQSQCSAAQYQLREDGKSFCSSKLAKIATFNFDSFAFRSYSHQSPFSKMYVTLRKITGIFTNTVPQRGLVKLLPRLFLPRQLYERRRGMQ